MRRTVLVLGLLALVAGAGWGLLAPAFAAYDPDDEWQGLPEGEGQEELYFNCIACHSTAIIQQQRLNRRVWDDILVWMIDDMGWPAPPEAEYDLILDYLVEHFGQDAPR